MLHRISLSVLLAFGLFVTVQSKDIPDQPHHWSAKWIAMQGSPGTEYGIYYFRKSVSLSVRPSSFKVHVSADNRYKLYVNGKLVALGPARGDSYSWNYETVDLAPYLKR